LNQFIRDARAALAAMASLSHAELREAADPSMHACSDFKVLLYKKRNGVICAAEFCTVCARKHREVKKAGHINTRVIDAEEREQYQVELNEIRRQFHALRNEAYLAETSPRRWVDDQQWNLARDAYSQSERWRTLRKKVFARDRYQCQGCLKHQDSCAKPFEVHHKTYDRIGRELLCDLVTLCKDCHTWLHDSEVVNQRREFADEWAPRGGRDPWADPVDPTWLPF
jgi:5-methylcytosine-specific restriction endonuclease McrA